MTSLCDISAASAFDVPRRQHRHVVERLPAHRVVVQDDQTAIRLAAPAAYRVEQRRRPHRRQVLQGPKPGETPPPRAPLPVDEEGESKRFMLFPEPLRVAMSAPSRMTRNFSHWMLSCTRFVAKPCAKPQSGPAITFSRPTSLA